MSPWNIALLVLVALAGCASDGATPPPVAIAQSHVQAPSDGRVIRRVVVPPFEDVSGLPAEAEGLRSAFIRALAQRQACEVVPLGAQHLRDVMPTGVMREGVVPRDTLIALARRFRADGVLFATVTHWKPYEPMSLGLRVDLVSASTGEVIWNAHGLFDAARQDVQQDVRNWHDTDQASTTSLEGWRVALISPARFAAYVSDRIVGTMPK